MSDLDKKARWANEAIGPAGSVLRRVGRGLVDLPADVTPGARQVAQLTAWRAAQMYAIGPIGAALDELSKLPDWTGGFLVADSINFDWRTAPFKHYTSFEDFYHTELESTWGKWDQLQATYRKLVAGEIDDYQAEEETKRNLAEMLAAIAPLPRHGGRREWPPDKVEQLRELHAQGLSQQEIGSRMNINPATVSRQLSKMKRQEVLSCIQGSDTTLNALGRGTEYLAARIKRDRPDIAAHIDDYPSIHAAARAAGILTERPLLHKLLADWTKASPIERNDFLREIGVVECGRVSEIIIKPESEGGGHLP